MKKVNFNLATDLNCSDSGFSFNSFLDRVLQRNSIFGKPRLGKSRYESEDAASFAEESGVKLNETFQKSLSNIRTNLAIRHVTFVIQKGRGPTTYTSYLPNDIERAVCLIGSALWTCRLDEWFGLNRVSRAGFTTEQRVLVAYQALGSLVSVSAGVVAEVLIGNSSGEMGRILLNDAKKTTRTIQNTRLMRLYGLTTKQASLTAGLHFGEAF